jgi:hypothetical protein
VWLLGCPQAFECGELRVDHPRHRRDTRSDGIPFCDHGAGTALSETASKLRSTELKVVTQRIEQRRGGVDVDGVSAAIDRQHELSHCVDAIIYTMVRSQAVRQASLRRTMSGWA